MNGFTPDIHGNIGLAWPLMPETRQPHFRETTLKDRFLKAPKNPSQADLLNALFEGHLLRILGPEDDVILYTMIY